MNNISEEIRPKTIAEENVKQKIEEVITFFKTEENMNTSNKKLYLVDKLKNNHYYFNNPSLNNELSKTIIERNIGLLECILRDKLIIEFDPIMTKDDSIDCLFANSVNGYRIMKDDFSIESNINRNMKEMKIEDLTFYITEISKDDKSIKFLRRYTNAKTLKKKSLPFKLINNSLENMNDELFFIDNNIDSVIINDQYVLVLNRYSFEIIFNYKENYKTNLQKALELIEKAELIENFEQFKEDCTEGVLIAKKFTKIMKEDNITTIKKNISRVPAAIEKADIPIEFKGGKIIYNDKTEIYFLPEILSDGFAETLIGKKVRTS